MTTYIDVQADNRADNSRQEASPNTSLLEDFSRVFDDDLDASIVELKRQTDAAHARLRLRIEDFDRRGIAAERYELTTKAWLAYRCRMTPREASGVVKSSRALVAMPEVAEAAMAGNVTPDGLTLLTQARSRHPDEFAHHETVFADIATYLKSADLRKAITHWSQQVDFAGAVVAARHLTTLRRLSHHQTLEGMWGLDASLDPESGSVLDTALRSYTEPQNLDHDDRRTLTQRRHDALVDI